MDDKNKIITASSINVLAGVWLLISPFVLGYTATVAATNDVILGVVVGVLALIRVLTPFRSGTLSVINAILGIWLIAAPFVLTYTTNIAIYNDIILGIVVLVLGSLSATTASHHRMSHA